MFFLPLLSVKAQVTISVQLPPGGMVQKDQLWNLVIVNNSAYIPDAIITLDVQDAVTGQTVLSAAGRNFAMGKGVKVLNIRDVQPLQYNFLASELSGSFIPLGTYIACYRLYINDAKGPQPLGDECVRMNIAPLSPPLLNTPANGAVLEQGYPQFTWLPPGPADMFSNLNYDLLVTEINTGQSPQEAILYNLPIYSGNNLRQAYQVYPASFSNLKEGKQYAWQVIARNGLNYSAQTEVWSFTIKPKDSVRTEIVSNSYIELKDSREVSGISAVKGDELLIKYYSYDGDYSSTIRLLSADGKLLKEVKQKIVYGNNFFRIKLGNDFTQEKVYTIELIDQKQNRHNGRFSIK